jgi:hypothetical protein
VLVRILQSRQFREGLTVGAIVLAALARMGKENQAGAMARLAAWNKRQVQFLERQAERQAGHLQRQARLLCGLRRQASPASAGNPPDFHAFRASRGDRDDSYICQPV